MDTYKLKLKIGDNEFEAEGPVDVVQAQFAIWKELISTVQANQKETESVSQQEENSRTPQLPHLPLDKIMKVDGRIVSLTARSETVDEAVLLILLGQKDLRANQEVTGAEVMDGLKQSGYMLERVDRIMDKLATDGSIITIGFHRGRRYRLSNAGLTKALNIAKEVIATVP